MRKKIALTALAIVGFNGLINGQTSLQATLSDYMQKVRSETVSPTVPRSLYETDQPGELLNALETYYNDSLKDVRRKAYYITYRVGLEQKQITQQSITQLIDGLQDKNSGIVGALLEYLKEFRASDYPGEARKRIATLLKQGIPHYKKMIKIAGFLNLEEQKDFLKSLLANQEYSSNTEQWVINLALARMGDENAIQFCLSTAKNMPVNDDFIYEIAPDLVYTRQKEIIDYLITLLMSEEKKCYSANPESPAKISCGYRIMEYLAPVIKDFPLQTDPAGEIVTDNYKRALESSRDWFKDHKDEYQLIIDTF